MESVRNYKKIKRTQIYIIGGLSESGSFQATELECKNVISKNGLYFLWTIV